MKANKLTDIAHSWQFDTRQINQSLYSPDTTSITTQLQQSRVAEQDKQGAESALAVVQTKTCSS